ncbi:MAG: NAD(P)/FAD-dependent oxidoreductase, partial [Phycisphaeraceae bacterium]|nr:NAD(P)/FAD-dependent oxidoreductase [Phycisphaeraceae bacterium]
MPEAWDIAVVGAGAAGLMAAIAAERAAAETERPLRVLVLDGARKLGAKILVAGGGRCNVTHYAVDESAYAGSSRHAIKQVLRAFGVERTVAFFAELGVELKREETGKLFPVTDDAHTVLDALLGEAARLGVELRHPWRVGAVEATVDGFVLRHAAADEAPKAEPITARRVILCTGGKSLPKSGSDGAGYELARSLGHTITPLVTP